MVRTYLTFDPSPSARVVRPHRSRSREMYLDLAVRTFPNGAHAKDVIAQAEQFEEWAHSSQEEYDAQLQTLAENFRNARAWAFEVAKTGELRAVFDEVSEDNPFVNDDWVDNIIYRDEFEPNDIEG